MTDIPDEVLDSVRGWLLCHSDVNGKKLGCVRQYAKRHPLCDESDIPEECAESSDEAYVNKSVWAAILYRAFQRGSSEFAEGRVYAQLREEEEEYLRWRAEQLPIAADLFNRVMKLGQEPYYGYGTHYSLEYEAGKLIRRLTLHPVEENDSKQALWEEQSIVEVRMKHLKKLVEQAEASLPKGN